MTHIQTKEQTNARTFFDGHFSTGVVRPREVVEQDYPCEYTLLDYLAAATAGEEIAVGCLAVREAMTREQHEEVWPGLPWNPDSVGIANYEVNLVAIPGVGIWVCEPVFRSAAEAHARLTEQLQALERALGRPLDELPIEPALIHLLDDVTPDLRGVDPRFFYDTTTFAHVAESLASRRSRDHAPAAVDAVLRELLEVGEWLDSKDGRGFEFEDFPLPRWLTERTGTPAVA